MKIRHGINRGRNLKSVVEDWHGNSRHGHFCIRHSRCPVVDRFAGQASDSLQKGSTSDTVAAVVGAPPGMELKAGSGTGEAVAGAGCRQVDLSEAGIAANYLYNACLINTS